MDVHSSDIQIREHARSSPFRFMLGRNISALETKSTARGTLVQSVSERSIRIRDISVSKLNIKSINCNESIILRVQVFGEVINLELIKQFKLV
jgi:hypothetical protein